LAGPVGYELKSFETHPNHEEDSHGDEKICSYPEDHFFHKVLLLKM